MLINFSNFFRRLFRKKPTAASLSLASVSLLTESSEAMLTCDQVFELIDQYAERAAHGEDVAHLMPLVAAHLELCPDCREHYEVLKRMLQAE